MNMNVNMRFAESLFAEPAIVKVVKPATIAKGENAGKPRPVSDQMLDQVQLIKGTVIQLRRNGFDVIAARVCIGLLPSIQVAASHKTGELIDSGKAVYYSYGMDADGIETRHGQCHINGVRVIWYERAEQGEAA